MGKNGKGGENDEKNNGKKEGLLHKRMEKNGTAMETVERIGREQWEKNAKGEENDEKNNGKKEGL